MSFSAIDNYNTISRASFFWGRLEDGLPPAFTSESLAGHLARLGDYFARFKGGSGKSWWKSWYWRWRGVPGVGAIRPVVGGRSSGWFKVPCRMATPTGRKPERNPGRVCDRPWPQQPAGQARPQTQRQQRPEALQGVAHLEGRETAPAASSIHPSLTSLHSWCSKEYRTTTNPTTPESPECYGP